MRRVPSQRSKGSIYVGWFVMRWPVYHGTRDKILSSEKGNGISNGYGRQRSIASLSFSTKRNNLSQCGDRANTHYRHLGHSSSGQSVRYPIRKSIMDAVTDYDPPQRTRPDMVSWRDCSAHVGPIRESESQNIFEISLPCEDIELDRRLEVRVILGR
jgi:hypothetical protein